MTAILIVSFYAIFAVEAVTLRKECPRDEVHKSCSFTEEYSCWQDPDMMDRVRIPPKRLLHCRSGCYCKRNLVREYPGGKCISTIHCQNRRLREVLMKIPTDFAEY